MEEVKVACIARFKKKTANTKERKERRRGIRVVEQGGKNLIKNRDCRALKGRGDG